MITIDGSLGEGGGQILRTALALATCLGRPCRIFNIRAQRRRPGLQPQHLAAVRAAAAISGAVMQGAEKDSLELVFTPGSITPGEYAFDVGTAGSTTLVLQTVLPALVLADGPSHLSLEGGTHNPLAPPFEFLVHAFLPVLNRMGPMVTARLERPGFAPRGGGRFRVEVQPVSKLKPLVLAGRGAVRAQHAEVLLAHLPQHIAAREIAVIQQALGYTESQLEFRFANEAYGPGNVVSIIIESEQVTECFTAFGQRGVPAEKVAQQVVNEVRRYLKAGVPVGSHLADQLLLLLALAGGGSFVTLKPSSHTLTNIEVIRAFVPFDFQAEEIGPDAWQISVA
jgi:RNA 3'-terminal phosphate cyclase (ATP)